MAIVGNGDLASALKNKWCDITPSFVFFASGVSDSLCTDEYEFDRERSLLLSQPKNKHIVYFSTLSIEYKDSAYTRHKVKMENLIKENFSKYTIIRIGNITWGSNPKTLLNFIRNKIKNNEHFEVQNVSRNVIEKKDLLRVINNITFGENSLIHLEGKNMKVSEIVDMIKKEIN